jgi:hypothetical protein
LVQLLEGDISALATKAEVEALRNLVLPKGALICGQETTNLSNVNFFWFSFV